MAQWYGCTFMCHRCHAKATYDNDSFTRFNYDHQPRTHADYIQSFTADALPGFVHLAFFHLDMVLPDWMHVVCLGFGQTVVGCTLVELCHSGAFGFMHVGESRTRVLAQLRHAYSIFKVWAAANAKTHSQRTFTIATLGLSDSSVISPGKCPEFKGKAFNTMVVLQWLASIAQDDPDMHAEYRGILLRSLSRQWDLFARCKSVYFTERDTQLYVRDASRTLTALKALFIESRTGGGHLWSLRPKTHLFKHIMDRVRLTRRNPASHWCFSDERYVGYMSKCLPTLAGVGRRHAGKRLLQRHYIRVRLRLLRREIH